MSRVFAWHERGYGLEVHTDPGALVRVRVNDLASVELPGVAVAELVEALVEIAGHPALENALETISATEETLAATEAERDGLRDELRDAEAEIARLHAETERHRTALHLADERTRATELEHAGATLAARRANEGLS